MSQQKTNRGFTIVELLIVIVVIAILAAITIIGFNGVQDRARDTTAAEAGSSLQKKIEAYNAVEGKYPVDTTKTALVATLKTVKESEIDTSLEGMMVDSSANVAVGTPIKYTPCTTTPATSGGTVTYWQKAGPKTLRLGSGTC